MAWRTIGRELPRLGAGKRRARQVRHVAVGWSAAPNPLAYVQVRAAVLAAVAALPRSEQWFAATVGSLPELMVGLALTELGLSFGTQLTELGGRLRSGGAMVDFEVPLNGGLVAVRVQGDYWHTLPERIYQDAVQADRLRRKRMLVADVWEHDLYEAWAGGRLREMVRAALLAAA